MSPLLVSIRSRINSLYALTPILTSVLILPTSSDAVTSGFLTKTLAGFWFHSCYVQQHKLIMLNSIWWWIQVMKFCYAIFSILLLISPLYVQLLFSAPYSQTCPVLCSEEVYVVFLKGIDWLINWFIDWFIHWFIHSFIGMCRMRQFLAVLRSFFHFSLLGFKRCT